AAPPDSVRVPGAFEASATRAGLTDTPCRVAGGGLEAGGVTVSIAVLVVPFYEALMTTDVLAETGDVVIVKPPVNPFGGTVTLAGTRTTAGLLLDSATTAPPS